MKTFEFRFKSKVTRPFAALKGLGLWIKTKVQIEEAFPGIYKSDYYRKLELFGMEPHWVEDWTTKINSMKTMERLPNSIPEKLCAIMLHLVWNLWPKMPNPNDADLMVLELLSEAMDRFDKRNWFAMGYGCKCDSMLLFTGQIDIYWSTESLFKERIWTDAWKKRSY